MVVKRCTTRTVPVLVVLIQAAQKFIFTLKKITTGMGGTCPLWFPTLWMRPWRSGLPISVNWTFFARCFGWGDTSELVQNRRFRSNGGR